MENRRIFALHNILEGGFLCLFVAGLFCARASHAATSTLQLYGVTPVSVLNGPAAFEVLDNGSVAPLYGVTPVLVLNGPAALEVLCNGSVAPFFYSATPTNHFTAMHNTENRLNGEIISSSNRQAHDTGDNLIYQFDGAHTVRVTLIDGEPWFVAKDVCGVLGIVNYRDATISLDSDELKVSVIPTQSHTESEVSALPTPSHDKLRGSVIPTPNRVKSEVSVLPTPSRNMRRKLICVSESGLYALIFKSRKPEAKKFRRWVTSEILPSIRKTGEYRMRTAEERRVAVKVARSTRVKELEDVLQYERERYDFLAGAYRNLSDRLATMEPGEVKLAEQLAKTRRELNSISGPFERLKERVRELMNQLTDAKREAKALTGLREEFDELRRNCTLLYDKFTAEKNAKNKAYYFIIEAGYFEEYVRYHREHAGQPDKAAFMRSVKALTPQVTQQV